MPKLKPVLVTWVDPMSYASWQDPDKVRAVELPDMLSLGWVVERSRKYIKVTITKSRAEDRIADTLMLPRKCVKSIEAVKLPCK